MDRPGWRSRSRYSTCLSPLARCSNGLLAPPSEDRCSRSLRDCRGRREVKKVTEVQAPPAGGSGSCTRSFLYRLFFSCEINVGDILRPHKRSSEKSSDKDKPEEGLIYRLPGAEAEAGGCHGDVAVIRVIRI